MSNGLGRKRGWLVASCLCAALLAVLPIARTSGAHGPAGHGGGGGGQLINGWTVLAPVSYKNLTLFPVRGRDLAGSGDYITLDEGIKNGTVIISEKGAGQRATVRRPIRRVRNGRVVQQTVSTNDGGGGASVNELALTNKSGKKLLLLSGEVVVGGQQDRIVEEDRVIPPVGVPVSLSVFCVEHGRWSNRDTASAARAERNGQVISHPVVASSPQNFSSLGAISHPKLRAAAQDKKEQGEVWKEVSASNGKLGTTNSTDTYQEIYASKKVSAEMDDYIKALGKEVIQPGVVGVVVARNGELVWVDAFASSSLFARYWPKLLKSYVVDAMGDDTSEAKPTVEQARRYLAEREGTATITGQPGVYQLVKTEHTRYAIFDLADISFKTPLRVHFNKMQR
jgi:hypothetical protein